MYRFLILIWKSGDVHAARAAESLEQSVRSDFLRWQCVFRHTPGGVAIYHAGAGSKGNTAYDLGDGAGVVLGTLFRTHDVSDVAKITSLRDDDCREIVSSSGRKLIEAYWGRYVAVVRQPLSDRINIVRDPSGGLPCFRTHHKGVQVFFSDLQDLLRLDMVPLSVNWAFVAAVVGYAMLQARETGLNEVAELPAGECIEIEGDRTRHLTYWDPLAIARSDVLEDPQEAIEALHRVTTRCVHAWASSHERILHRLSGGLDSAIVLSCLATAPSRPVVTCLNYYSESSEEDERLFARLAADQAGCELIERRREVESVPLRDVLNVAPSPRPWFYLYSVEHSRNETQLARSRNATALFGGLAGDGIFYQNRGALAASDYLHAHGLRPSLITVALNAARVDRTSVWPVLRNALLSWTFKRTFDPLEETSRYRPCIAGSAQRVWDDAQRFIHPWLSRRESMPHGKLWHVFTMAILPPYYDPLGSWDDPESIYPLISQPLIELCLRIPTYVLISGGWDRAIARRAFARQVPREIIYRRDKGASNTQTKKLFDANLSFLREVLLDGVLVKERLLNRAHLERSLEPRWSMMENSYSQILISYLSIEAWLRRWSDSRKSAPA